MSEIEQATLTFYGYWQAATCFFAFLALTSIWYHLGRRKNDYSQIYLALSILCWSITGICEIFHTQLGSYRLAGLSSVLSLANSFFILMSLPWFRYLPSSIKPIVLSKYWVYIIGLPFVFSLLPTISKIFSSEVSVMISELDVYYSILTLGFLGLVLWESFAKRRLKLLGWLSLICILITFIAQIYKITGNQLDMRLFSAIFKSTLIMIFFALALSWVKDLSENILPSASDLRLRLKSKLITIIGISGRPEVEISLSPSPNDLLNAFIQHKMDSDRWLEIKPKNDRKNTKAYPINDHNEIKRLTHAILDAIYGKSNWSKEQHEIPFKSIFYETPEEETRKIRLRMPAENIEYVP